MTHPTVSANRKAFLTQRGGIPSGYGHPPIRSKQQNFRSASRIAKADGRFAGFGATRNPLRTQFAGREYAVGEGAFHTHRNAAGGKSGDLALAGCGMERGPVSGHPWIAIRPFFSV